MEVVSIEQAKAEVKKWLESLGVDEEKQNDTYISAVIKGIARSISEGLLVINDDGTLVQKLLEPLGEKGVTSTITYSGRYRIGDYHEKMQKISSGDTLAAMFAKLSVLSNLPELMFKKMIKQDWDVAANITVFF